ncbi:MAG: thiol reductase thioredoxin [Proteobacteria bacterium]|nr:thiol reductase thioredoxin [Pseudomonadota bacterium]MBU1612010.1 thiol reductase thioredoxin [Pseudomonadota bacterium]
MSNHPHIVCSSCGAINRVDLSQVAKAVCGKCKGAVYPPSPLELTASAFDRHVFKSGVPVLVDFWSPGCGPCQMMGPQFAEAAQALYPGVRLFKVNTQVEQALAGRFDIMSVPTLALFRNGKEIARQPGAMAKADIMRWVQGQILLAAHGN